MKISKHHCYRKLAEREDDLEDGFFFVLGTLQGEKGPLIDATVYYNTSPPPLSNSMYNVDVQ